LPSERNYLRILAGPAENSAGVALAHADSQTISPDGRNLSARGN
jgi:hypothetical protein